MNGKDAQSEITNLKGQVSLLRIAKPFHFTSKLHFFHCKSSKLTDDGAWLSTDVITEDSSKKVKS